MFALNFDLQIIILTMKNIHYITLDLLYSSSISITTGYMQFSSSIVVTESKMPRKRGNQTIYSSQEASQMIFMDTLSEGSDVDLAEDLDSVGLASDSDFEPEEEDTELSSEDENQSFDEGTRKGRLPQSGPPAKRGNSII